MKVLSLFSGVGGFDLGLEAAGWQTVFQCEIDPHCQQTLAYHWPDVPRWDDVTTLTGRHILDHCDGVDVVAWGSPCQDLSVAGKRAGLSGERSGLFHHGIRIIKELRELTNGKSPTWSVWENVAGALSSNGGADFGQVLYEMDEAGACFSEWAVLDAQHFGVPQRRRRVFVISCFDSATAERCGTPLLPVSESGAGDSAKGNPSRKGTARTAGNSIATGRGDGVVAALTANGVGTCGADDNQAQAGHFVPVEPQVVGTIGPTFGSKNYSNIQEVMQGSLVVEPIAFSHTQGLDAQPSHTHTPTLRTEGNGAAVAYDVVHETQTRPNNQ